MFLLVYFLLHSTLFSLYITSLWTLLFGLVSLRRNKIKQYIRIRQFVVCLWWNIFILIYLDWVTWLANSVLSPFSEVVYFNMHLLKRHFCLLIHCENTELYVYYKMWKKLKCTQMKVNSKNVKNYLDINCYRR